VPITPRKLAAVIKAHTGKYHPIAKELKVNVYWIHSYITKGIEPRNPEIRARMFLPKLRKKTNGRSGFTELPAHVQWWRKLKKDERNQFVKHAYEEQGEYKT
jgi:hypothetical protein